MLAYGLIALVVATGCALAGYRGLERFLEWYFLRAAGTLIEQEKKGELSRDYGYVWSEINLARKMQAMNRGMVGERRDSIKAPDTISAAAPVSVNRNFPSLSAIRELNRIRQVSNLIVITDRHDSSLAEIKTTHTRLGLNEFNPVLVRAIIVSEDRNF